MSDTKLEKPTNVVLNQTPIQKPAYSELINQNTLSDIKYQDVHYYMYSREKTIESDDHIHIDFFKALSEMSDLDWNYEKNYIGFVNNRTNECVQFIRQGEDKWYAEVPINHGKDWEGYTWSCYSDSKSIFDMLQLFFDEVIWFHSLPWKMRRFKH